MSRLWTEIVSKNQLVYLQYPALFTVQMASFLLPIMSRWVSLQPSREPAKTMVRERKQLHVSNIPSKWTHPYQTFCISCGRCYGGNPVRLNALFAKRRRRDWGSACLGVDAAEQLSEVVSRKCWQSNAARGPFKRQLLLFSTPLSSGRVENAGEFLCAQQ